jgi:hypothetical protein
MTVTSVSILWFPQMLTLANNKSQLVSEYVRTFVTRYQAHRPSEQLLLPII